MEQKGIANILKIFCIGVALVGALFFFWYMPERIGELSGLHPETIHLKWPGIIGIWMIAVLCYIALGSFWSICTRIGKDNSFCMENAKSMKIIGVLALLAAILVLGSIIFLACVNWLSKEYAVRMFFLVCIAVGIGVICLALSALIQRAALLKEENDLTI